MFSFSFICSYRITLFLYGFSAEHFNFPHVLKMSIPSKLMQFFPFASGCWWARREQTRGSRGCTRAEQSTSAPPSGLAAARSSPSTKEVNNRDDYEQHDKGILGEEA
jgi:hypothetical protein